ncbi:MAG: c-type cytochrome [Gemmatimonadetes bacterium]|nr:c-type cytochrome [Gemmatimonadota bacterium]
MHNRPLRWPLAVIATLGLATAILVLARTTPAHAAPAVGAARAPRQGEAPLDSAAITPAMIAAGRGIFHNKGLCFACHGAALEGTQVAPTLKAHAWRDAKNGDLQAILGVLTKGVPSTAMVAYPGGISPADARAVAAYVWSVGKGMTKP